MGKKRIRKAYTSKGVHSNVTGNTLTAAKKAVPLLDRAINKVLAWQKGLNPWITIPGPSTNMKFVRVRANEYYGDPKRKTDLFKPKGDDE